MHERVHRRGVFQTLCLTGSCAVSEYIESDITADRITGWSGRPGLAARNEFGERDGLHWRALRLPQPNPVPGDVVPGAELEADPLVDADAPHADRLVERHARRVG